MIEPLMPNVVLNIAKFLIEQIRGQAKAKQERIDRRYKRIVEESFLELKTIHQDYSTNLSKLRDHLVEKSLPPRELIQWLRKTGLQYRTDREKLATIEVEIWDLEEDIWVPEGMFNPPMDEARTFYWRLHQYVRAILRYYEASTSYGGLSYYRDFENSLEALLSGIEISQEQDKPFIVETFKNKFYETQEVQDTNRELIRICDKVLPERWQEVVREYRRVRAAAGYPD
jgi:hypothetical protein